MKAVKTQSWNSSEYQNLKLSLQREINPKPHLNTAPVFIISATDATFLQPKIYFTLGFFLQCLCLFTSQRFQCVYPLFILMLLIYILMGIRKWENSLQNNICTTIFLGIQSLKSCQWNNNCTITVALKCESEHVMFKARWTLRSWGYDLATRVYMRVFKPHFHSGVEINCILLSGLCKWGPLIWTLPGN